MRPFRQYTMGTGVLCKKGNELGNTFRGWADFQLTDNIIAKTHIGHFTFWHASVVTNPKCLFLAEDIFCTNTSAERVENACLMITLRISETIPWLLCAERTQASLRYP